jgi:glycerophosphoryl diester phosphodiesterase
MNVVFPFHKPLVLGHRGDCAHAPENTLAAFSLALESGADGIELDARLTHDGAVMVLHDAAVDRVSNGRGRLVDLTRAEVERLDAGTRYHPRFAGEQIPTLQKVFETFGARAIYDLEIKNFDIPFNGLESRVLELVRRFDLEQRVIVTSFNPLAVRFFRRHLPKAPVGLLLLGGRWGRLEENVVSRWASSCLVGLNSGDFSARFSSRQKGRGILVWGVKSPEAVRSAVEMGATVVVADDPGMAHSALNKVLSLQP